MKTSYQNLALDMIDYLVDNGSISIHSQIGSKDFLGKLINLLKSRDSPQVQVKILGLIKKWGTMFEKNADILPNFSNIYKSLIQNNVQFPNSFKSEYSKYLKRESSKNQNFGYSQQQSTGFSGSNSAYVAEDYHKKDSGSNMTGNLKNKPIKLFPADYPKKYKRFVEEMNIVIENIELANQIIDATEEGEEVDDGLRSIMMNLKKCEESLLKAIQTQINDESLLANCLKLNDDLNQTSERFNMLKAKYQPVKFVSAFGWTTFVEPQKTENNQYQKQKMPSQNQISQIQQPSEDIFGFFSDPVKPQSNTNVNNFNNNNFDNNFNNDPFSNNNNNNYNNNPSKLDVMDIIGGFGSSQNSNNNVVKNEPFSFDFSSSDNQKSAYNSNNNVNKDRNISDLLNKAYSNQDTGNIGSNSSFPISQPSSNTNNLFGVPGNQAIGMNQMQMNPQSQPGYNMGGYQGNPNMPMNMGFNQGIPGNSYPGMNMNMGANMGYGMNQMPNMNPNMNMNFNNNMNMGMPPQQQQPKEQIVLNKGSFDPGFEIYTNTNTTSNKPKDKLDGLNPFA